MIWKNLKDWKLVALQMKFSHEATRTQWRPRWWLPLWDWGTWEKCCAPFNRSLILATWFIHVATADITTLINHAVRHAGCPRARAGLTNLNTIFHLNNLALPQGRPTPDTAHWRGRLSLYFYFFHSGHKDFLQPVRADKHSPVCSQAGVGPLSTTGNNEKLLHGHQRN